MNFKYRPAVKHLLTKVHLTKTAVCFFESIILVALSEEIILFMLMQKRNNNKNCTIIICRIVRLYRV